MKMTHYANGWLDQSGGSWLIADMTRIAEEDWADIPITALHVDFTQTMLMGFE